MRRRVDYEPRQTLTGSELRRVMTLLMLLLLVGVLMYRARDPRMWTMFATQGEAPPRAKDMVTDHTAAAQARNSPASKLDTSNSAPPLPGLAPEPPAAPVALPADADKAAPVDTGATARIELPPLDEDEEERQALDEELSVVVDNQAMLKEEMAAYYRLFRWAPSQTYDQLAAKAEKDVRFGDIFDRPQKYRGKPIDLRLHVRRVLLYDDLEKDNPANLEKIWEIVGYNDSSGYNLYMCITDAVPPEMPVGPNVTAEGRFAGYFLKLMKYEDGQGKRRAIPVFIGKFRWEPSLPQRSDPERQAREWIWVMLIGVAIGVVMLVRWGMHQLSPGKSSKPRSNLGIELARQRQSRRNGDDPDTLSIEAWLENTENSKAVTNPAATDDYLADADDFSSDQHHREAEPPRRPDGCSD